MNFRVEFVRPRSVRFWGSERRGRGRSTCLAWRVFVFVSRQKWGVAWLATGVRLIEWRKLSVPLRSKQSNVCAFLNRRKSKFVYSILKWLQTKILEENWWYRGPKKDQSLFESSLHSLGLHVACEQAPGWVKGEIAECSLGRAGRAESGLVRRECFARGFTLRLPLASLPDSHFARRIFFRSRREPVRRLDCTQHDCLKTGRLRT